jgi:PAS domain S-box-containing protein
MKSRPDRSRLILPLAYAVAGVAWVVGSDYILGEAVDISLRAQLAASAKGVVFVLVSAFLLYVVQAWPSPAIPVDSSAQASSRRSYRPFLIFAITAAGVCLAGWMVFQQQTIEVSRRAAENLAGTAELTARQIETWLTERRTGLEYAGRNPLISHALRQRLTAPQQLEEEHLQGALDVLRLSEGFERVQVFGPDGLPLVNAGGAIAMSDRLRFWIRGAAVSGRVVMSDLYVPDDAANGRPAIDFVVTLEHENDPTQPAGVLVARADPDRHLFGMLTGTRSMTPPVSFTLARRQGRGVTILLPPGERTGPSAAGFEYPIDAPASSTVQVAGGRQGVFNAVDLRGVTVLATGRAIANTPWYLVARQERQAVLAPLQRIGRLAMVWGIVGLLVAASMVALWWRSVRLSMAVQIAAAERRATVLKEHFAIAGRFVHDIVLLLDERDGRIVEANDRALEAYGYTHEELLARTVFQLRPAGSPDEALARQRFESLRTASQGLFQARHWRKDGSSFPVEISARMFTLAGQRYVQMIGRDISDRVEHEQRLAALSAERDRLLERQQMQFMHMASACIVVAADGRILQTNPAHERLFGLPASEIEGRFVGDIVRSEAFRDEILRWMEQLRATPDVTLSGVYDNVAIDGRPITCRWTATALRNPDGTTGGMIGMADDITEQVMAERALRNSEERYRTVTELSPVGIFRTDLAGMTVFVNARCSEIIGLAPESCLGLGWVRAIHPEDVALTSRQWRQYVESLGKTSYAPEFRLVRPDGSVVWVLAQIAPETDLGGHVQGHIGTITDITALKAAQHELQLARDQLEERVQRRTRELEQAKNAAEHTDRVKSAFLSTMSHELRTPLNSILGFSDVLLQGMSGPLTEPQQKQLQIVRDSAAHLRALIEDVLDISRIEAGQVVLDFADVDLPELVARRAEAMAPEAARKGIELRVEAPRGVPLVRSDPKRTAQIVDNLLSNAIKFTDRGSVTVSVRRDGERVEVAVADTGMGIAAGSLDKLFNPFTQVVRPGGRLHEGTGLGLAISRNLARAMGGEIVVESVVDQGSTFTFTMPLARDQHLGLTGRYLRPDATPGVDAS